MHLSADEVLSTTRAVRKRLDLNRPVPRALIEECVDLAAQAPTGRNRQRWHFLVVTDKAQRVAGGTPLNQRDLRRMNAHPGSMVRIAEGFQHLYDNIHRVPAFVIPAVEGRTDHAAVPEQAGTWGSILPAVWSFMLAARERGLAEVLGVPHD
jgi:nitroreductase